MACAPCTVGSRTETATQAAGLETWPLARGGPPAAGASGWCRLELVAGAHACSAWRSSGGRAPRAQVLRQDRAPLLYSLVFGEGVINDATAVALLRAVQARQHLP